MQSEPLILVVEDNTILRRVIVDALEERGYRIESAADFPEGAIKLRAAAPALLIADVNLPNGDGRNLKNLARATDIPVLLSAPFRTPSMRRSAFSSCRSLLDW